MAKFQGGSTKQQSDKKFNKMMEVAKGWQAKGFSPKVIAEGIWNKFGYTTEVKNDKVIVWRRYNGKSDQWFVGAEF